MIDEPHEIVKAYCSAWNERDDKKRLHTQRINSPITQRLAQELKPEINK